ncbi:unnamed protein product, partial [Prorocentrum cordatum]
AGLSRAAKLRREANSASKAERKAASARRAFEEASQAVGDAEAELQAAQEKLVLAEEQRQSAKERLTNLEAAAAEARDNQERHHVSGDDLAAMRGLFVQLRTLLCRRLTRRATFPALGRPRCGKWRQSRPCSRWRMRCQCRLRGSAGVTATCRPTAARSTQPRMWNCWARNPQRSAARLRGALPRWEPGPSFRRPWS